MLEQQLQEAEKKMLETERWVLSQNPKSCIICMEAPPDTLWNGCFQVHFCNKCAWSWALDYGDDHPDGVKCPSCNIRGWPQRCYV